MKYRVLRTMAIVMERMHPFILNGRFRYVGKNVHSKKHTSSDHQIPHVKLPTILEIRLRWDTTRKNAHTKTKLTIKTYNT